VQYAYAQAHGLPPNAFVPQPPGLPPAPQFAPGTAAFPTHPFARSPRDFFMYDQGEDAGYARYVGAGYSGVSATGFFAVGVRVGVTGVGGVGVGGAGTYP
jgi:hypothetical protein